MTAQSEWLNIHTKQGKEFPVRDILEGMYPAVEETYLPILRGKLALFPQYVFALFPLESLNLGSIMRIQGVGNGPVMYENEPAVIPKPVIETLPYADFENIKQPEVRIFQEGGLVTFEVTPGYRYFGRISRMFKDNALVELSLLSGTSTQVEVPLDFMVPIREEG